VQELREFGASMAKLSKKVATSVTHPAEVRTYLQSKGLKHTVPERACESRKETKDSLVLGKKSR
jgi:hypothetical protein